MLGVGGDRVIISQPVPLTTLHPPGPVRGVHSSGGERQSWVLGIVCQLKCYIVTQCTMEYITLVTGTGVGGDRGGEGL